MKKVDAAKWKHKPDYIELTEQYKAELRYYVVTTSEHGKSTAEVACGFCETKHEVYIWSFRGSGKRCRCCGALMGAHGSAASAKAVKNLKPEWDYFKSAGEND